VLQGKPDKPNGVLTRVPFTAKTIGVVITANRVRIRKAQLVSKVARAPKG